VSDGFLNWLAEASDEQIATLMKRIPQKEIDEWPYDWKVWGRESQQAPAGDWRVWLVMAGRGFRATLRCCWAGRPIRSGRQRPKNWPRYSPPCARPMAKAWIAGQSTD
jgi:hypothetical protein